MSRPSSVGLALAFVAAAALPGCLSPKHTLTPHELTRLAQLPPEARGTRVRVVQQISDGDETPPGQPLVQQQPVANVDAYIHLDLPTTSGAGPARTTSPSGGWAPATTSSGPPASASGSWRPANASGGWTSVDDGGASARAIRSAPPVGASGSGTTSGGASATSTRTVASGKGWSPNSGGSSARWSGGDSSSGKASSGKGSSGDAADAAAAAALALVVVAFVAATFAGVALAVTEGARFEGDVRLHPRQPVHLVSHHGSERIVPLGELHVENLRGVREGYVREDEVFGVGRLDRAPLDRRGLALRLGAGATSITGDRAALDALALDLQIGVFPSRRFGLLGTLGAAFTDGSYAANGQNAQVLTIGLELQGYPASFGPLHLGIYGRAGTTLPGSGDTSNSSDHYGFAGSAGGLVELELTTTFALTGRLGWSTAFVPGDTRRDGLLATVGFAIY